MVIGKTIMKYIMQTKFFFLSDFWYVDLTRKQNMDHENNAKSFDFFHHWSKYRFRFHLINQWHCSHAPPHLIDHHFAIEVDFGFAWANIIVHICEYSTITTTRNAKGNAVLSQNTIYCGRLQCVLQGSFLPQVVKILIFIAGERNNSSSQVWHFFAWQIYLLNINISFRVFFSRQTQTRMI